MPEEKRIDIGLTIIFGVGRKNVAKILKEAGVGPEKRVKDLTADEVNRLQKEIEKIPTEGALKKIINENITRLRLINTYRGLRHAKGLPVRGQRTRSNARTRRGKRKTVGALKKEDAAKVSAPEAVKETVKEAPKEAVKE